MKFFSKFPIFSSISICAAVLGIPAYAIASTVVLNQTSTTDVVQYLIAGAADYTSGVRWHNWEGNPVFTGVVSGFPGNNEKLTWTVNAPQAANYRVYSLHNSGTSTNIDITVNQAGSTNTYTYTTHSFGWDKFDAGTIHLPQGVSTITLSSKASNVQMEMLSLELIEESKLAAYQNRVKAFRSPVGKKWLQEIPYGLFQQFGPWGYPYGPSSTAKLTIDDFANNFDVQSYVNWVVGTGAKMVYWSTSWWEYRMFTKNSTLDTYSPGNTSKRDLIKEVAQALKARGIRFGLYYHSGHTVAPQWWSAQNFPAQEYAQHGTGNLDTFISNWMRVIGEIGENLGPLLDAWWIDDGAGIYYPSGSAGFQFESMSGVARKGNPSRIVTYNHESSPRVTDFADTIPGFYNGVGYPPIGGNGIMTEGDQAGLQGFSLTLTENDWGVHQPGQKILFAAATATRMANLVADNHARNIPTLLTNMMWSDGTGNNANRDALRAIGGSAYTEILNDDDKSIKYSGAWSKGSARGLGDYRDDVHASTTIGDSLTLTFIGDGIDYVGPRAPNLGKAQLFMDGRLIKTIDPSLTIDGSYEPNHILASVYGLSYGEHVLKLTLQTAGYLVADEFVVSKPVSRINDDNPAISYVGTGWSSFNNREPVGDYNGDLHATRTQGDFYSYEFFGDGVEIIGPKNADVGDADIYIDGAYVKTVSAKSSSYLPQQLIASIQNLGYGQHTLKIVNKGNEYLAADRLYIHRPTQINNTDKYIRYAGSSWLHQSQRQTGDYGDDLSFCTTNGCYFEYAFNGSGITLNGPWVPGVAEMDVYIDGALMPATPPPSSDGAQRTLFQALNLPAGQHTLRASKKNGQWMVLDTIIVAP